MGFGSCPQRWGELPESRLRDHTGYFERLSLLNRISERRPACAADTGSKMRSNGIYFFVTRDDLRGTENHRWEVVPPPPPTCEGGGPEELTGQQSFMPQVPQDPAEEQGRALSLPSAAQRQPSPAKPPPWRSPPRSRSRPERGRADTAGGVPTWRVGRYVDRRQLLQEQSESAMSIMLLLIGCRGRALARSPLFPFLTPRRLPYAGPPPAAIPPVVRHARP